MEKATRQSLVAASVVPCLVGLSLLSGAPAKAQNSGLGGAGTGSSYHTMEPRVAKAEAPVPTTANSNGNSEGPVRLARFAYVLGNVTWRSNENAPWADATTNLPLREGAQIWVTDGGRAEIQFDDGSLLRLGNGAVMTLQTLYSDAEGEFTEIKLTDGLATLRVTNSVSVYQFDTPLASIKAGGPTEFRLGVDDGLEVAVRQGNVAVEGPQQQLKLAAGDYLQQRNPQAAFAVGRLPQPDSWDLWNDERDELLNDADRLALSHLPPDIGVVAGDLDDYGSWHNDPTFGYVWSPHESDPAWRPYHAGQWMWVAPFGWTWVSHEPWGWAPYHYGTWVHESYGWAWVPGPGHQCWSPGVVDFSAYHGQVAWCPLAPTEVRYPALPAAGTRFTNLSAPFSVGQVGIYYAANSSYWVARPIGTATVNQVTSVNQTTSVTTLHTVTASGDKQNLDLQVANAARRNPSLTSTMFVPINAVQAAGASAASAAEFGHTGMYRVLPVASQVYFAEGHAISLSSSDVTSVSGSGESQPAMQSTVPTFRFVQQPQLSVAARRSVFAAPLPSQVQQRRINTTPPFVGAIRGGSPAPAIRGGITTLSTSPTAAVGSVRTSGQSFNLLSTSSTAPRAGDGSVRTGTGTASTSGTMPRPAAAPTTTPVAPPAPATGSGARPPSSPAGQGNSGSHSH